MLKIRKISQSLQFLLLPAALISLTNSVQAHDSFNIIMDVVNAPVVTNGLVAGEPTEINILLRSKEVGDESALDPANFGHQIPSGGWMEVELSGKFMRNRNELGEPIVNPVMANRNIILTTAPQNPIVATKGSGVQHGNWRVEDGGDQLLTIVPIGGNGDNGLEGLRAKNIGFKVIHIRPNPRSGDGPAVFVNGPAGMVGTVSVRIYAKDGELKESGYSDIVFQANIGPQINITNAGLTTGGQGSPNTLSAELVESTIFQHVAAETRLVETMKLVPFSAGRPYAPRFLLFDESANQPDSFIPQVGLENVSYLVDPARPWTAKLVVDGSEVIGAITLAGPMSSSRGMILANDQVTAIGGNGSVLNVPVKVGKMKGLYTLTVTLVGGGSAVNTIIVDSK